eukprot:Nitzschia sp. Nitz4//scaffold158_size52425//17342//17786//NITZ4_006856-RA/size52425-snap-gene-0.1-mRNA-1//-1//CDS//3329537504//8193//frame0
MASTTSTPTDNDKRTQDVTLFVRDMLNEMESEFTEAGASMLGRMDEVGKKLDDLERSISDLMTDAGLEKNPATTTPIAAASQATPQSTPAKSTPTVL